MSETARRWLVSLALVGVAAVWGTTFVMVADAVASYPVYSFLGLRFGVATIAFMVLFPSALRRIDPAVVKSGIVAGGFLTAGYVFQTLGLAPGMTTPGRAAFITGMFVVITPFMQAVILKRMPKWTAWVGVVCAVSGLWLLTGGSVGGSGWNLGDTLVLVCAVAYSGHMIVLGSIGRAHDMRPLTLVQLATVTVVCGVMGLGERAPAPTSASLWIAILVTGVLASAVAFAVQTYAQKHLSPTRTALILICEPAFGGLFAWLAIGERLGSAGLVGAILILAGMAASEVLATVVARRGETAVLEVALEGPPAQLVESDL